MNGIEVSQVNGLVQEYLIFILGCEEYVIDIFCVQEICGYDQVIVIVNVLFFIKGVINLCGVIVLIVDLCIKFYFVEVIYDLFIVVIIFNIGWCIVGVVVDLVFDVIVLGGDVIRLLLEFGVSFDIEYLFGLVIVGECMLILVDIERLMISCEMVLVDEVVV